ncbi:hypothetical protein [Nitratifractor sp.]|uniref:hypothetical protein n=1 Tax=Nitratifractor sp. TaxID=2268144 RepID=UPI0025EEBD74|nr:hypothetical protein [Nitratifractor sp.]
MASPDQQVKPFPSDKWEEALAQKLETLKACQQEKGLKSCLNCEAIVQCEIRTEYVNAVYESMNKGTGGGFEF